MTVMYLAYTPTLAFAQFHELAINNVTAILKTAGKIKGPGEAAHSETIGSVPKSASKRSLTLKM